MGNGVRFSNIGEELIAQAFAFRGAGDETGDIDKLHRRGDGVLGIDNGRQSIQARVGHRHDTGVWLDCAERKVFRVYTCLGQGIKESRFTNVGQTDNTAFESH